MIYYYYKKLWIFIVNATIAMVTPGSVCQHSGLIDIVFAMEESVIQQHLTHYKQAIETAREELAALQAKYNNLQSQVYIFAGNSGSFWMHILFVK